MGKNTFFFQPLIKTNSNPLSNPKLPEYKLMINSTLKCIISTYLVLLMANVIFARNFP
jgi:hypothetical protein